MGTPHYITDFVGFITWGTPRCKAKQKGHYQKTRTYHVHYYRALPMPYARLTKDRHSHLNYKFFRVYLKHGCKANQIKGGLSPLEH